MKIPFEDRCMNCTKNFFLYAIENYLRTENKKCDMSANDLLSMVNDREIGHAFYIGNATPIIEWLEENVFKNDLT